jgi:hypothetical protein
MAYGLQIFNDNSRTMLDSNDTAPNTFFTGETAHAYTNQPYPPSGTQTGDLVLCRPTSTTIDQVIGIDQNNNFVGSSSQNYFTQYTTGVTTAKVRRQDTAISATPSSGEYGMDVFDATGTSILFSATRSTHVKIIAQGLATPNSITTLSIPSGLSYNRIYAVVDATLLYIQPQVYVFPSWVLNYLYTFKPSNGTIEVSNLVSSGGSLQSNYAGTFPWALVYNPN